MKVKKVFPLLILAMMFLSSCSQSASMVLHQEKKVASPVFEPIPVDFIPQKVTVLSAGDSLTQGVGDSTEQGGYLPYLKSMLEKDKGIQEVDFYNYGVKGNRTTQLLKRLKSLEMKPILRQSNLVILTIGGNDIMKIVKDNISDLQVSDFIKEKESYRSHLTQIFDVIYKENPNAFIVLVGVYNPFSKWFSDIKEMDQIVAEWNQIGDSVVSQYSHSYFVSIEDLFLNADEDVLYTDNFHPNDKGYKLIAERLNDALANQVLPALEKNAYTVSNEEN
ncbi:SGNH/GDSL hydrolase family protein [Neobacillus drentensis]|uniref:SGNH/GDSL hydrolase family protein n=1 Tax=Neobacillus drentensis TaxID=220684 RepID=UPI001F39B34E|nr:SGNH/GDSL hydrolase family protein [Neobacillus drentensis]ULT55322.1 SGNH/GDSL hydrolase family protein [Neobacillus drentensis]